MASCLKIIVCGSDSAEKDQIHSPEAKTPSDKRGWSFRKKSGTGKHRVLGNNVSSENTTFADKETLQGGSYDFQAPIKSVSADEKPPLAKPTEEVSKAVIATETDSDLKTSVAVITPKNDAFEAESKNDAVVTLKNDVLDAESKSDSVVTSKNDALEAESKVIQNEVAVKSESNEASAEDRITDAAVVAGNDSNQLMAENKLADAAFISGYDSNETSDETSIASESFVSKDDSIKDDEPRISESGVPSEDGCDADAIVDEPAVIIIQSAMRRFLAERLYLQLKSAIKLQAVIRGHLVRRNAVETLHCIRAIVKVQTLVRARSSKSLGYKNRPHDSQFSTMKLLQNSFARQLLESTSKPKSLNIRCDPMRSNSSWGWLERWMSVSTSEATEKLEPIVEPENAVGNEVQEMAMEGDAEFSSVAISDSADSKFSLVEGEKAFENEENHITDEVDIVNSGSISPLPIECMIEQSHLQKQEIVGEDMASAKIEAAATDISSAQVEPIFLEDNEPGTQATEFQEPKLSMKRSASSELNDEGKKFVCASRKASNPAFIAAHSKFEELTSASNSGKLTILSQQDVGAESHVEFTPSSDESLKKATKPSDVEASGTFDPRIHVARSECGTEISVSSTLDSPDRSDIENTEAVREVQFLEETSFQTNVGEKQDNEADGMPIMIQQGEIHGTDGVTADPIVEVSSEAEDKLENNASDGQTNFAPVSAVTAVESSPADEKYPENVHQEHESNNVQLERESTKADHQAYKSSPEASPISHKTVQESQGTPSSQASLKDKRNKVDKRGSNRKRSSPSSGKKSPSNTNVDSGARSSTENLPKDQKSGKRRNSFGSTKSESADQEPRDSSTRNPLPSYMQATESARAKANSPRSSPDVHDKEIYSKKRHSLPGATGRQVSPNVQRLSPQPTQGAKANGSHPSNERKWQR